MRYFFILLFFQVQAGYCAYLDRHYEGICTFWEGHSSGTARLDIISFFLPENPTIFEVGTFNGVDSVSISKKWPQGRVISFEANPNQFKEYQKNTQNCKNTEGYNLAVNTYNGFAEFYLCWGYGGNNPIFEGASSLLKAVPDKVADYEGPTITVPCVIFDDWCKYKKINSIDFMWLDLEGFELQLLKSSPDILKTVQVIYTETNLRELRLGMTQFSDLNEFLVAQGFELIAHWYSEGYQGDAIYVRSERL